jgi:hypothetical protein
MSALLLAAAVALWAAPVSDPHELVKPYAGSTDGFKQLPVFPEKLVFNVSWGVLGVGEATLSVPELVSMGGRPAYRIVSEANSNKFCDGFYKVRDVNESWLDAATLSSLGYSKKLREGNFFRDEWVLYDYDKKTFNARKIRKDASFEVLGGTIPGRVQDVLSTIYWLRTQKSLEPGTEIVVDVNTRQNWPLVIRVVKRMTIATPAGSFKTILVEPALRQEGIFIQKGKKLQIWLTDDERKMPVLMKVEVFFGHITARLAKVL